MKYTYGDLVNIKNGKFKDKTGTIVGVTEINTEYLVKQYNTSIGKVFYTVEFGDGTDNFFSEGDLELNLD